MPIDGNLIYVEGLARKTITGYANSYVSSSYRLSSTSKNETNISFGYDHNGNVTSICTGYNITTLYDWRNLPLSITKSSTTYSYKYDHLGNRTYKSSGNTRYVRGAFGETMAVYSGSTLQYRNILRPDGTVIGRREGSNRLYYHRDHLGSTRAVANASGSVVETHDYYPFGLQMPGRSMVSGNSAKEKFTSHELDSEVDLYYMIARRYAPEFGRFMSVDPLADEFPGWSSYNYTLNNPLIFTDPTGLCAEAVNTESIGLCFTGEAAQAFFKMMLEAIVQTKRAIDNTRLRIENVKAIAADAKDAAIDRANFIASEGPEFLDKIGDAAAQTTLVAGSATAASLKTPTLIDTKASASATVLFAGITLATDITATALSGIDAAFFDGDREEFRARFQVSLIGGATSVGSGLLFKRELRRSILDRSTRRAFNTTATTSTSKVATDPIKRRQ